ncbi:hypothetical protein HY572_05055 [Candidatus Micrarchaeota archaeon]|nr:hypothetical protein [Candidatus Micrarchaeota archaeon]
MKALSFGFALLLFAAVFVSAQGPSFASITSPGTEDTVSGTVNVQGSALYNGEDPLTSFLFDVFVCPSGERDNFDGCTRLGGGTEQIEESTLATWDTNAFESGNFFDVVLQVNSTFETIEGPGEAVETASSVFILVDNEAPTIESAELDHSFLDLEDYGADGAYFYDPKCTYINIETFDEESGINSVTLNLSTVLNAMFARISDVESFNEEQWQSYLANYEIREFYGGDRDPQYSFWYCPLTDISGLLDYEVISYDDMGFFLSQKIALGEFELPVTVADREGNQAETSLTVTITDLTVPLEQGWTLRSSPIALEQDQVFMAESVDAVLSFDSASQAWQLVTDGSMEPLEGYYFHSTARNQLGLVIDRGVTSPPSKPLAEGWSLVGPTLELSDYWEYPEEYYCEEEYSPGNCRLSYIYVQGNTCIGQTFNPVVYDASGNRALELVVSPQQYLSYSTDWGSWYFSQNGFSWIPNIEESGASPDNSCEQSVYNFGGYWTFLQNDDTLPGQTTTPLFVGQDD